MTEPISNSFDELFSKDISGKVDQIHKSWTDRNTGYEKHIDLSYLSWANGWKLAKEFDPEMVEEVRTFPLIVNGTTVPGVEVPYLQTPVGYFVCNTVTIKGRPETEWLPIMNSKQKTATNPSALDINTAIKRCFVKALAKHGLGLQLYIGEDIPDKNSDSVQNTQTQGRDNNRPKTSSNVVPINKPDTKQLTQISRGFKAYAKKFGLYESDVRQTYDYALKHSGQPGLSELTRNSAASLIKRLAKDIGPEPGDAPTQQTPLTDKDLSEFVDHYMGNGRSVTQ